MKYKLINKTVKSNSRLRVVHYYLLEVGNGPPGPPTANVCSASRGDVLHLFQRAPHSVIPIIIYNRILF